MERSEIKILLFTWNTQSIPINEETEELSQFWEQFSALLTKHAPHLVCIGFQEDIKPGSYFHSGILPKKIAIEGYTFFDETELMGLGKTCMDGLKHASLFLRGLRISLYIREEFISKVAKIYPPVSYHESFFKNKGAVALYCTLKGTGETIAFINTHFPYDAGSTSLAIKNKDKVIRQDALNSQNSFFNGCYRKLVLNKDIFPSHAFLMGDLNYRMDAFVEWSAAKTGRFILENLGGITLEHDELRQQMEKNNIYSMCEGIACQGPLFPPTCKLNKNRDVNEISINAFNVGREDSRVPSYCDRILYTNSGINCLLYERMDSKLISQSDHAAVYGVYAV